MKTEELLEFISDSPSPVSSEQMIKYFKCGQTSVFKKIRILLATGDIKVTKEWKAHLYVATKESPGPKIVKAAQGRPFVPLVYGLTSIGPREGSDSRVYPSRYV